MAPARWYGIVLGDSDDNSLVSLLVMSTKELLDVLEVCGLVSWNSDHVVKVYARPSANEQQRIHLNSSVYVTVSALN